MIKTKTALQIAADKNDDEIIQLFIKYKGVFEYAFYICCNFKGTTIPSNIQTISDNSFYGCLMITEITLPCSIKSIGDNAFSECTQLKKINLPSSITQIGTGSFPWMLITFKYRYSIIYYSYRSIMLYLLLVIHKNKNSTINHFTSQLHICKLSFSF